MEHHPQQDLRSGDRDDQQLHLERALDVPAFRFTQGNIPPVFSIQCHLRSWDRACRAAAPFIPHVAWLEFVPVKPVCDHPCYCLELSIDPSVYLEALKEQSRDQMNPNTLKFIQPVRFYLWVTAVILFLTGLSKILYILQSSAVLATENPVFSPISQRWVYLSVALLELAGVAVIVRGNQSLGLWFSAWLAGAFLFYRGVKLALGISAPCRCLGGIGNWLGLSEPIIRGLVDWILVWFCMAIVLLLARGLLSRLSSRHFCSVFGRTALMLALAIGLNGFTGIANAQFTAAGEIIETRNFMPPSSSQRELRSGFEFSMAKDGSWVLRTDTPSKMVGGGGGFRVSGFDGANSYSIYYTSNRLVDVRQTNMVVVPIEKNDHEAKISLGSFPIDSYTYERIVWLAMVGLKSGVTSLDNSKIFGRLRKDIKPYVTTATLEETDASQRPTVLLFRKKPGDIPVELPDLDDPSSESEWEERKQEIARLQKVPPETVFHRIEFNYAEQGNPWASRVVAVSYDVRGAHTNANTPAALTFQIVTTNFMRSSEAHLEPPIYGTLTVDDYRLRQRDGNHSIDSMRHSVTNSVWPRNLDAKYLNAVRAQFPNQRRYAQSRNVRRMSYLIAGVVLLVLVPATLVICRYKKNTTNESK